MVTIPATFRRGCEGCGGCPRAQRRVRLLPAVLLAAGLAATVTALASPGGAEGRGGGVVVVEIRKYAFVPTEVEVRPGTVVRWINREKRQYHSVWFEQAGEAEPEYFFPGESYERRFDTPGTYPYRCGPHEEMRGVVRVVAD